MVLPVGDSTFGGGAHVLVLYKVVCVCFPLSFLL